MNSQPYNMEIGSFLRFSIENAKRHWLKFIGVNLACMVIMFLVAIISFNIHPYVGLLLTAITGIALSFGGIRNVVRLSSGQTFDIKAYIPEPGVFLNFMITVIVISLLVFVGTILLIVPGVIMFLMFCLAPFYVIEQKMSFVEAMKQSVKQTKGHKMDIFLGVFLAMFVCNLISSLVITLFFTIPMSAFIYAYPYVYLSGKLQSAQEQAPPQPAPIQSNTEA
jgi:uncharacterized membrane protein